MNLQIENKTDEDGHKLKIIKCVHCEEGIYNKARECRFLCSSCLKKIKDKIFNLLSQSTLYGDNLDDVSIFHVNKYRNASTKHTYISYNLEPRISIDVPTEFFIDFFNLSEKEQELKKDLLLKIIDNKIDGENLNRQYKQILRQQRQIQEEYDTYISTERENNNEFHIN